MRFLRYLMRILGIDPGTATTGFAIIDYENNICSIIDYGCIKTAAHQPLSTRLREIGNDMKSIIEKWRPDTVAIEELFFSKNVKTAMQVAHARGAIMQQLSLQGFEVAEYKPQQIKEAVCGYGKAAKIQIQKMIQIIFNMDHFPTPDDAADALAVAVCHAHNSRTKNLIYT